MESENKLPTSIETEIRDLIGDCKTGKDLIEKMINMEQAPCPVHHHFVDGQYVRELEVKAGTFLVGHMQKKAHLNIFVKGKVAMYNADGTFKVLTAPMCFVAEPGRKIGFVMEDMLWVNVYKTDKTDVNEVEEEVLDKSILNEIEIKQLPVSRVADHMSYLEVIERLGFTQEQVQQMVDFNNVNENYHFPSIKKDKSDIHGQGIFATSPFFAGEFIGMMLIGQERTILGRYVNHSATPNAQVLRLDGTNNLALVAIKPINGCKGGLNGDEITTDYEHTFKLAAEGIK